MVPIAPTEYEGRTLAGPQVEFGNDVIAGAPESDGAR
jgi:hypothetical protein